MPKAHHASSTVKSFRIHSATASIGSAASFATDILRGEVKMGIRERNIPAFTLSILHVCFF